MTESEWLTCEDPGPMLGYLRGRASDRKLRLFACACCRRVWHMLTHPRHRAAVELAERFADGQATAWELGNAYAVFPPSGTPDTAHQYARGAVFGIVMPSADAQTAARDAVRAVYEQSFIEWRSFSARGPFGMSETSVQAEMLRDLFGNLFRPAARDSAWQTHTVVSLAQAAYDERSLPVGTLDPARLAVLADALEEAGCTSRDVLLHCRGARPHFRGCWVLDLLTGRE